MDSCVLCLEINKDILDGMSANSTKWQELDVMKTIEKHFWSLNAMHNNSWICLSCWRELDSFHKFYLRIEEAHMNFSKIKVECKEELNQIVNSTDKDEGPDKDNMAFYFLEQEILIDQMQPESHGLVIGKKTSIASLGESDLEDMPLREVSKRIKLQSKTIKRDPLEKSKRSIQKKDFKSKLPPKEKLSETKAEVSKIKEESADLSDNESQYLSDNKNETTDVKNQIDIDSSQNPEIGKAYNIHTLKRIENDKFIAQHFRLINCDICQELLPNFPALQKHFLKLHRQRGYIFCCNRKYFNRRHLVDHIHCHLNPEHFKCTKCGKVLSNSLHLEKHIARIHGSRDVVRKFSCDVCGKAYIEHHLLRRHLLTHMPEEEKKFLCKECGKFYASSDHLHRHMQAVHLKKFVKICYICGKALSSSADLKVHLNKHEGIQPAIINCDVCGLRLTTERGLKIHKANQHPPDGKREHHCPTCPKVSPTLKALRKHINTMHKKGYDHKCTICAKVFKRAEVLREHMASHTGTPLYTCPWCPKTFNSNSNMHSHRKKMHPKEWAEAKLEKYSANVKSTAVNNTPYIHTYI